MNESSDQRQADSDTDSEAEAAAAYERWQYNGWFRPLRSAAGSLLILAVAGGFLLDRYWNTSFRWPGVCVGLLFVVGALSLFYDIPQRRLGRLSLAFLKFGLAMDLVLILAWAIHRWGAD